ncbi:MAG: hypothetical protein KQH79_12625 [Bacteroidetes bacterium]|nr:hypothetical protein [Bacteroidota bacterium]
MIRSNLNILKLLLIFFITGYAISAEADEPNKLLQKNNIIIYDLDPSENNNHYKAIYYIDTDLNHFRNLVLNPKNHEHWISNIKSAENISQINDSIIYSYVIISVQSILKKEAVVKTVIKKQPDNRQTYIIQQIDTSLVYDSRYKRLKSFTAQWNIREVGEHKIEVKLSFLGTKKDYPDFIDRYLRSLFVKKIYKIAYRSRKQAQQVFTN